VPAASTQHAQVGHWKARFPADVPLWPGALHEVGANTGAMSFGLYGVHQRGADTVVAGPGRELLGPIAYIDVDGTLAPTYGKRKQGMGIS